MADKKNAATDCAANCPAEKTVIVSSPQSPTVIVCDVCGHVNPENTALCKMCSNYLEGDN